MLFGFDLLRVKGHGDVVKWLIDKQTNVQFESDGGEVGKTSYAFQKGTKRYPITSCFDFGRWLPRSET